MSPKARLQGLAILVVEDDYYQADDAQRALAAAGARVAGPYARFEEGLSRLVQEPIDCGVLDVNLGEGPSFVAARALKRRQVPFVFLTGYGPEAIPADLVGVEVLEKPVETHRLISAVARACGRPDAPRR
ncbi:response regulator [Caulobacter sp. LARHSG274]